MAALVDIKTDGTETGATAAAKINLGFAKTDENEATVAVSKTQLLTNNGFNRQELNTLGVVEFCPTSAGGIVHQFQNDSGVITYVKLTSQTNFADSTAYEAALADRTLAIYPKAGETSFDVYMDNTKTEHATLKSVQAAATRGVMWFYFSASTGNLMASVSPSEDIINDCAIVAIAYYNATSSEYVLVANEQHGIAMNGVTHKYLHNNMGALYTSGLDVNGLAESSDVYTSFDAGYTADEDVDIYSASQTNAPFWYKLTSNVEWKATTADLKVGYIEGGDTYPSYNDYNSGDWQITEISNNNYVLVHLLRTNDGEYPMAKVLGEEEYSTASLARAGALTEIANLQLHGLPTPEITNCYTIIVDSSGDLVLLADGSTHIDWRGIQVSGAGGESGTSLHEDLTDTDTEGHPVAAITGAAALATAQTFTEAQRTAINSGDNSIAFDDENNFAFTASAANITVTNQTVGQAGTIVITTASNITGWGTEFDWGNQEAPTGLGALETFGYFISGASGANSIKIGRN